MSNFKDRNGIAKPQRSTVLFWWWSRYFGLRDAMTRHALLPRRFPPPWIVEDLLVVKDSHGVEQLLGVVADVSDKRLPEFARACVAALGAQLRMLKAVRPARRS